MSLAAPGSPPALPRDEARAPGAALPAPARRLSGPDLIVLACLAAAVALAWLWLSRQAGADHGMPMPATGASGDAVWSASYLAPTFLMWALMMVAMMLPSAIPMILLHARVARPRGRRGGWAETILFALTYVAVWTFFSAAAALAQASLVAAGLLSALALSVGDTAVAAALLAAAALYQFSSAKRVCLDQCRSPLFFILRLWRPGLRGSLRLGLRHGLYCLGCCWMLMLLLFVGGVMNLAWVAMLAAIVLAEKYAPPAWRMNRVIGAALLAGAVGLAASG